MEAPPSFVEQRKGSRDFYLVSGIPDSEPLDHAKAPLAMVILILMVVLASTGVLSMLNAASLAAIFMLVTRCCSPDRALRNIEWSVLVVIGAALGIGYGLEETGAATALASTFIGSAGRNPWVALAMIHLITAAMTEMITNNAAAALMFPIALAVSKDLGVSVLPFVISVMIAASSSFMTPIGYQTNLMVYGPGGYRFSDFIRVGAPLTIATHGDVRSRGRDGIEVNLPRLGAVRVGLIGRHQAQNAAVALATLDAMREAGIVDVSDDRIVAGFAAARWPGRLELIDHAFGSDDRRDLLLDGAHNEDGAAALAAAVDDLAPHLRDADGECRMGGESRSDRATLIVAAMSDKAIDRIFGELATSPVLRAARLICTTVGEERSSTPEALADAARRAGLGAAVEIAADPQRALDGAARDRGPVIVAGSLYLVGAVRERLMRQGRLPDDGSLDPEATTGSAESRA